MLIGDRVQFISARGDRIGPHGRVVNIHGDYATVYWGVYDEARKVQTTVKVGEIAVVPRDECPVESTGTDTQL